MYNRQAKLELIAVSSSRQWSLCHDSLPEADPVCKVLAHLHPGLGVKPQILMTIRCSDATGLQGPRLLPGGLGSPAMHSAVSND